MSFIEHMGIVLYAPKDVINVHFSVSLVEIFKEVCLFYLNFLSGEHRVPISIFDLPNSVYIFSDICILVENFDVPIALLEPDCSTFQSSSGFLDVQYVHFSELHFF